MLLHTYLEDSVRRYPARAAVRDASGGMVTFEWLGRIADDLRARLAASGVEPGDRVGIYLRKSIDAVGSIFGILKAGAAYVPVDAGAPVARNAFILHDCRVKLVVVERQFAAELAAALSELGAVPAFLCLDGVSDGSSLRNYLDETGSGAAAPPPIREAPADDLAYILYTSGSTGKPKGVQISHRNATSFVDWCSEVFEPTAEDRFSSHAPFHFDLSILDIYTAIKHGAALVLIREDTGKRPAELAEYIARTRMSVWYSTPSILALLAEYGRLEAHDLSALRVVLFAGEVFPVAKLRALKRQLPVPRYFNLYGPTETNVCTFYEIPTAIPDERTAPFPIGKVCSHLRGRVVDGDGNDVPRGDEGELCISGPSVTRGYWGLPEQTATAFLSSPGQEEWYRTGDIVAEEEDGDYRFVGRRDRMVKRRGYRVELGEIEACLYRHASVREAAVLAESDGSDGVSVRAHLSTHSGERLSAIELKGFCSRNLPVYMVPDRFLFHERLPRTSTDKIDYQALRGQS